jgi:hypothetical protein
MNPNAADPLTQLRIADPRLADSVESRLAGKAVAPEVVGQVVSETLWALGIEISFGEALAAGYSELAGAVPAARLETYRSWLREAGRNGPTLGRILAECLPAILRNAREEVLPLLRGLCAVLAHKGVFTLEEPLRALGRLLGEGDHAAAEAAIGILHRTFAAELTYAESRYFSRVLPQAALGFKPARRVRQLAALDRVIQAAPRLAEPFLAGLENGLRLLDAEALDDFVAAGLAKYGRQAELGSRFLALESKSGQERFASLQVSVGFLQVRERLQRYLRARTGLALAVRSRSELPAGAAAALTRESQVCSDAEAIYFPDEIGWQPQREGNIRMYKLLLRLEASFHEFGTLEFDLDRLRARCRELPPGAAANPPAGAAAPLPAAADLDLFLGLFPDPVLAGDLFTVFELGRIRRRLGRHYPGLVRSFFPQMQALALGALRSAGSCRLLQALLARVAFGVADLADPGPAGEARAVFAAVASAFEREISDRSPVEASAELVQRCFDAVAVALRPADTAGIEGAACGRLATPYGWRPWPNPATAAAGPLDRKAAAVREALARQGLQAYRSEIRRRLAAGSGCLSLADIRELCRRPELIPEQLAEILDPAGPEEPAAVSGDDAPAFWYPEWDERLGDYLRQHVLVRERPVASAAGFYESVLARCGGLVLQTRQAFERMRPEGLRRLRRWPDGDELDYPKLIEAAIDRRSGDPPSDRLYTKRIKDRRDVAALLLVDLSRSTANRVAGAERCVLDVEKDAMVVLCEALTVLGDAFAVAGFSGTGRLGVDYYRIKGFGEALTPEVKARIGGLAPQRNTRMGAAIRHAGRELEQAAAKVRLLIVLGDGFPNDRDYKQAYALADTRRALMELRARRIRVNALTVNLPAVPDLDELYGKVRHQVIADVRELPERLIRAYSALTRQ